MRTIYGILLCMAGALLFVGSAPLVSPYTAMVVRARILVMDNDAKADTAPNNITIMSPSVYFGGGNFFGGMELTKHKRGVDGAHPPQPINIRPNYY